MPAILAGRCRDDKVRPAAPPALPYWVITFAALTLESATQAPEPLTDDLRVLAPRTLLIISADRNPPERAVARVWAQAAGPSAVLWRAPAGHTKALEAQPRAYARRVLGLFAGAL